MIEPAEHCSDENKAEEGDGKFLVACGDAAMAFNASEQIFDGVAMAMKHAVVVVVDAPASSWRNMDERTAGCQIVTEVVGIDAAFGRDPAPAQVLLQRSTGMHVKLRAGRQTESNRSADFFHDRSEFRVESALGFTFGLVGLASPPDWPHRNAP